MFSDIISALNLNSSNAATKFILATKDLTSDLNFVFCEILSNYIKNNYAVILINFAQSSSHYNHLLLKSGINSRQLRDQQKIVAIDALLDLEKFSPTAEKQDSFWSTIFSAPNDPNCLKDLYFVIKKSIVDFQTMDSERPFIIFIDEISVLLNLGVGIRAIEPFVQYCMQLTHVSDIPNLLFMGIVQNVIDDKMSKLVNYLCILSDINIQVEGLKTGYSKEADGKVTLWTNNKKESESYKKQLLFKITEKGAKLLTLGL